MPFSDCISEINNTQIDNAKDLDAVMPMYNLINFKSFRSKIKVTGITANADNKKMFKWQCH